MRNYVAVMTITAFVGLMGMAWADSDRVPFSQRPSVKIQQQQIQAEKVAPNKGIFNWLDPTVYAKPQVSEDDDRTVLRKKWTNMIGLDVFYPYFKAKQVEKWAKEKASVKVFKFKGRPEIKSNRFRYVFNLKF